MRNYLYISDAKVDALLPQFSKDEKRRIALRFGLDVKIFSAQANIEKLPLTNRVHRVEAVETKLRDNGEVGDLSGRTSWFAGSVNAMVLTFGAKDNAIFFLARRSAPDNHQHFFGLGGSDHHVIGNLRPQEAVSSMSHFHTLLDTLTTMDSDARGAFVIRKNDEALAHYAEMSVTGTGNWSKIMMEMSKKYDAEKTQPISFVARRLVPDSDVDGNRYTFATPLYVSADDIY